MASNPIIRKLIHTWFMLKRPMTMGVRILVENADQEILLVKHTYVKGWYFPGGGIETGETAQEAVHKELYEETGIEFKSPAKLLGVYFNRKASRRDHVLLFKVTDWESVKEFVPNREIAEIGFFPIDHLPEDCTPATRRRISEHYFGDSVSETW